MSRVCKQPDCDNIFEPKSHQEINCKACSARLKKQNKRGKPKSTVPKRKGLLTDKEQRKIDNAVLAKIHAPPDPGRIIKGEEFEQLRKLYEKGNLEG